MEYSAKYTRTDKLLMSKNPYSTKNEWELDEVGGEVEYAHSYYNLVSQIADDVKYAEDFEILDAWSGNSVFSPEGLNRVGEDVCKIINQRNR